MPLIILGLIVVLGGCLLIYYQLGPKVTLRLKSRFGGGGAAQEGAQGAEGAAGAAGAAGDTGAGAEKEESKADDEKILYVFGDGGREERSLHKDKKGEEEDGQGEDK